MLENNYQNRIAELERQVAELKQENKDLKSHGVIRDGFIKCIEYAVLDPDFNDLPSCNRMGKALFAAIRRLHQLAMK